MHSLHFSGFHFWWIFPLIMMLFCFFMVRRYRRPWSRRYGYRCMDTYRPMYQESAIDILEKRFVVGEISREEFEERKKVLEAEDIKSSSQGEN